jgi:adenylate cyclase
MRLFPNIRYGTERYPDRVARRLRVVNIVAWVAAAITTFFAILRFIDPAPGMRTLGAVNAAAAIIFASLPLLHRVGPHAASLVLLGLAYAVTFRVIYQIGTGGGTYLYYLTATALGALLLGTERRLLTAALSALAAGLVITAHVIVPYNTGLLSPTSLFATFVTSVVVNTMLLFGVVRYAVREMARAEAAAEREFVRSEALLANILPAAVVGRLKAQEAVIADQYDAASVLFADMAGFTARASDTAPPRTWCSS